MTSLVLALLLAPPLRPDFVTMPVPHDADDPAIWVNPTHPEGSRILGTDKEERVGGLYVFDLQGRIVQRIPNLDRPNNVDVEGNLAVLTERKQHRLRIYRINPKTGYLTDASGETEVFHGEKGDDSEPMGIALYRRRSDRAIFAIVTPKGGPKNDHLAQYQLVPNARTGKIDLQLVRRFGKFSGVKETESVAVDDALGFVYYSDETVGTRKYHADPDAPQADREIGFFNRTGTRGDHEGIAVFTRPDGTGLLVCADQRKGNSMYRVFRREGDNAFLGEFSLGADETDGIEMLSAPLGPKHPLGIFVAMNSQGRNFFVADNQRILKALRQPAEMASPIR